MESYSAILPVLGLTPESAPELPASERNRLLNFLLRWGYAAELHACLDTIIPRNRPLVSLLDLRLRAFLAQGDPQAALHVLQERLSISKGTSLTTLALELEVAQAQGDTAAIRGLADAVIETDASSPTAWRLRAEALLACEQRDAALAALRQLQALTPTSRAYALGMVELLRQQGDWVTATAYAVGALREAQESEQQLSIPQVRALLVYFQASGDAARAADMEAELASRYAGDVELLRRDLGARSPAAAPEREQAEELPAAEVVPMLETLPVSPAERETIAAAARDLFGFADLLPGQPETIAAVLRGEDLLTILPTGGGKSLCYQLPAFLAERGVTLVISPLIALMKDQLDSLPAPLQAQATTINSSLEGDALRHALARLAGGKIRLAYAAPERLRQPSFLHLLRQVGVNRLVIDEAHCVSVWGHDFRPDYLYIARARQLLGSPPVLALSATAPPRVRRDIVQRLAVEGAARMGVYTGAVVRPNLRLSVFYAKNNDAKLQHLLAFCQAQTGSGIIYAGTRARCEELTALLRRRGVDAVTYHAGMGDRARVQDAFMAGRTRVVVATVAFGMGIDKPDIRFIVHFVPPPSLEAYYQEAGRAGRDGLPAECLLMYSASDRGVLTRRAREDQIPVEFLRSVYKAVKTRLGDANQGGIPSGDLERDTRADETRVRVALGLLEQAELLRRGPDIPRNFLMTLTPAGAARLTHADEERFKAFCAAVHLKPEQALFVNPTPVLEAVGLSLDTFEEQLLTWSDAGWLHAHPSGRDLGLTLLPPPPDASERVAQLLESYAVIQAQRVDEIAAYAQTARCRHGYFSAYLGGQSISRCQSCDNCVTFATVEAADLPDEDAQLRIVLALLAASHGWGRASLARILRGDPEAPPAARNLPGFGQLAFRSEAALSALLARLENEGALRARVLGHGGEVLELTPKGRALLK
ncbi:MAG: RecQ family ATP-dependent DNA helicase [Anaerolineae bacterium]|jgi:ATP-dependent DNA helicase RecQ|nr:RecQ family ATP-dependent DNA helicase [Anaerolineae bacterium]